MLLNRLKETLDASRANTELDIYEIALWWLSEHKYEQQREEFKVRKGYGKHAEAIQFVFEYPNENITYITVEAMDYQYHEFQETL